MNNEYRIKLSSILIFFGIVIVLAGGIWIWKNIEISKLNDHSKLEISELKALNRKVVLENNEKLLRLLAKPLVWAIRTELLKKDKTQLNEYINEIIKEENCQKIMVVNELGVVLISSNKKDEGQSVAQIAPGIKQNGTSTEVTMESDSLLVLSSPIMGFNSKLGTVVLYHSAGRPMN